MSRPRHLVQQIALECDCCTQTYYPNRSFHNRIDAFLFGAEPYAMCPICEQKVSDDLQTERYKRYWRCVALPTLDERTIRVALLAVYLRRGLASDQGFHAALIEAQAAYPDKTINQLKALGDAALVVLDTLWSS